MSPCKAKTGSSTFISEEQVVFLLIAISELAEEKIRAQTELRAVVIT